MAMTRLESQAKSEIMDRLAKQGYVTYSELLNYFHINLTSDPKVVGYMIPNKGVIVLNKGLNIDQVSVVVRHEILHEYLSHELTLLKHLADQQNLDFDKLDDLSLHKLKNALYSNKVFNYAGDYDISNRGYTEADKKTVRQLELNGQIVGGLVTEDDYPDWVDLSIEDMYDNLMKEMKENKSEMSQKLQQQSSEGGQSSPQIGDMGDADIQQAEEIEREAKAAAEQAEKDAKEGKMSTDAAKSISNSVDEISDTLNKLKSQDDSEAAEQERLKKIKELFNDIKTKEQIDKENTAKIRDEIKKKAEKNLRNYRISPLEQFKISLDKMIKKQVGIGTHNTWAKFNKDAIAFGVLKPGVTRSGRSHIPSVNVYFDQSGSWSSSDIEVGEKAIAVLEKYVRHNKLKVNLYYFSDDVSGNASEVRGGGTELDPVISHINATKPDNVVIMTDNDGDYCHYSSSATVPGAVWFLWRNGKSSNLQKHLKGTKLTQSFDI